MAYEIPGFVLGTLKAGADLSTKQFQCVVESSGALAIAGAGVDILGVLRNAPGEGQAGEVVTSGVAKVLSEGTIASGAKVKVGSAGGVVTAGSSGKGIGIYIGEEACASGDVISVLLKDLGTQS